MSALRHVAEIVDGWDAFNISIRPFEGFWGFNPSVHYDGDTWRCMIRFADYHAPNGVIHANKARGGKVTTRNVLVELDPTEAWRPIAMVEILEKDGLPRFPASAAGYEDLRLFRTERDGFCAVATTMQLTGDARQEVVICHFDDAWQIDRVTPIRGAWSSVPQKNWAPFDGAIGIRLLYSIERGLVFDTKGPIDPAWRELAAIVEPPPQQVTQPAMRYNGGVETRHTPRVRPMARADGIPSNVAQPAKHSGWNSPGLRGGSQLMPLDAQRWLGIAHEMRWEGNKTRKLYWHVLYTCDQMGRMLERSEPFKLSTCGIEFAAGMAIDDERERLVISYGTEDQDSYIGVAPLDAMLAMLAPITPIDREVARRYQMGASS